MAFVSTKTLKALTTKHVQATGTSDSKNLGFLKQQEPMEFYKPTDFKLANESTADEGFTSAHQESSSDSDWESEAARQPSGCTSASETPKAKAIGQPRLRVATEPTTAAQATTPRPRASTGGSSTAWSRQARLASQTPEEKIQRAVRAVLNKLTIEKFEPLYETLVSDCGLSEPEHMSIVMREVFEKATMQHHFIEMYADLCVRLESDPFLACARGPESERTSFKHLLLTECQLAFERLLTCRESAEGGREEREELALLRRQRALGNVKLVGHLMVRGMLSSRLLVACCDALLRGEKTCPEALESLAALLTVTGKTFDGKKEWQHFDRLTGIFARIEELTKEKRVPARSRFLIRDLLDLRAAGWPSQGRPAVAKETPKTLDAIQAEWEAAQPGQASWSQAPRQPVCPPPPPPAPKVSESQPTAAPSKQERPWHQPRKVDAKLESKASPETTESKLEGAMAKAASIAVEEAGQAATQAAVPVQAAGEFSLKIFRKDLAATLKQLSLDRNVAAAVRRVRGHQVPEKCQAREMTDLLTRAAEEPRGPVRRSAFAFACGLAAADPPAFSRSECLKGVQAFFEDVATDLLEELPRLPQWISGELVPTLKSVFAEEDLKPVLPAEYQ